ncbi:hypothetical protein INR49_031331 [Caranx melampygus]|nr:hypothetical protein INR49_031331 [Caranx melampygus]
MLGPTDCDKRLVCISWEPPAVSLCRRLSAEEEGFMEQKGHHHSGILLLGSLDSSLGTRPTLAVLIKQIHPGTQSETRALLHSVMSSIFRHIAERTKSDVPFVSADMKMKRLHQSELSTGKETDSGQDGEMKKKEKQEDEGDERGKAGGRRQEEISGGHVTQSRAGLCVCAGQWQRSVGPGPSSSVGEKKSHRGDE